jgi:hypothetical protein
MFPTASLTSFLLLAVSVAANPTVVRRAPISLPFTRQLNITGAHDVVQKDQARAKNLYGGLDCMPGAHWRQQTGTVQ